MNKHKNKLQMKKQNFMKKSKDPINQNVIPEQMNQDIVNNTHNPLAFLQNKSYSKSK